MKSTNRFPLITKYKRLIAVYEDLFPKTSTAILTEELNKAFGHETNYEGWCERYERAKTYQRNENAAQKTGYADFVSWFEAFAVEHEFAERELLRMLSLDEKDYGVHYRAMIFQNGPSVEATRRLFVALRSYASENNLNLSDIPEKAGAFLGIGKNPEKQVELTQLEISRIQNYIHGDVRGRSITGVNYLTNAMSLRFAAFVVEILAMTLDANRVKKQLLIDIDKCSAVPIDKLDEFRRRMGNLGWDIDAIENKRSLLVNEGNSVVQRMRKSVITGELVSIDMLF